MHGAPQEQAATAHHTHPAPLTFTPLATTASHRDIASHHIRYTARGVCACALPLQSALWEERLAEDLSSYSGHDELDNLGAVADRVFPQYVQLMKLKGLPADQVRWWHARQRERERDASERARCGAACCVYVCVAHDDACIALSSWWRQWFVRARALPYTLPACLRVTHRWRSASARWSAWAPALKRGKP